MSQCRGVALNRKHFTGKTTLAGNRVGRTLLTKMTPLMILKSWANALRYPVSRSSATCFHMVASCSSRDGATHVHSLHLGESVRSWTSFLSRLSAWREEKNDAGSSSQKCECRP